MGEELTALDKKQVLVTGACGFIGRNLVEDLLALGAHVTVLDLPGADWTKMPSSVTIIKADILDMKSISGISKDTRIVYHLAAKTDLDGKNREAYRVNYEGTKNLILTVAKKCNRIERFILYSTQLVVGIFNETRFIKEDELFKTKTYYGESKIEAEKVTTMYCREYNIKYTIIRPTSVYGPWGQTPYRDFFKSIKQRKYPHIGKASNLVSLVYVKNLTSLTILASTNNKAINEVYFGNDLYPYTMRQIVDEVSEFYKIKIPTLPMYIVYPITYSLGLLKLFGVNVPIYPSRLKNIRSNYCYDIKKSLSLGYMPEYGLKEGVAATLTWYEKNKLI